MDGSGELLGRGSNRLDIYRRLLGAGRNRFRKPPAAFSNPCQFLGAAAHLLRAATDAGDHALHALLEAAGELRHHAQAVRLRCVVLRRSFPFHAANSQRVFAENLDSSRHAADLIARLATRDRIVELAAASDCILSVMRRIGPETLAPISHASTAPKRRAPAALTI